MATLRISFMTNPFGGQQATSAHSLRPAPEERWARSIRDQVVQATSPDISGWKMDLSAKEVGDSRSMVDELSSPLYTDAEL